MIVNCLIGLRIQIVFKIIVKINNPTIFNSQIQFRFLKFYCFHHSLLITNLTETRNQIQCKRAT